MFNDRRSQQLVGSLPQFDVGVTVATAPKAAEKSDTLTVETFDNHVWFYANVEPDRCLALMRSIRELDNRLRTEQLMRGVEMVTPIWLHINSNGGDVFTAFAVADQLRQIQTPVYSIAEGMCASAATLISMACTRKYISPNSFMLIHQFSSFVWGTYEQFKDDMKLQDMLMERLVNFYALRSKTEADAIREMLKHDTWIDSAQAIAGGFADAIIAPLTEGIT